ncbi:DUF2851 family protein [Tellurirhabdus bombi]|uniref:DUF2851 family protein n=1 Tax=Tellurirhabdus bombi TaxID=2907205 RepID=UPI001F3EB299|nr:DUF2851 family protein [Tellurirhabdus bombi]
MSEDFLYFLWQFQYFRHDGLQTDQAEPIEIYQVGYRNEDAGPDFTQARLRIGTVEWSGTVEIHIKASDWRVHRHQYNRAYDNVILHVVWENDLPAPQLRTNGSAIPTLSLQDRADRNWLNRYQALLKESGVIPCAGRIAEAEALHRTAMLDKMLLERMERKAKLVKETYEAAGQDWEETTYRLLATAFGFGINSEPFAQLTRGLSLKVLHKHRNNLLQIEALLFGVGGLLPDETNEAETEGYVKELQREYRFLKVKYRLEDSQLPAYVWKWAKLRPAGFPSLRIAQFAQLVAAPGSLFAQLIEFSDKTHLKRLFQINPSVYWQTHYRFGKASESVLATLGDTAAESLLINVVAPLLAAYAHHTGNEAYLERAVELLENLPAEYNRITKVWKSLCIPLSNAFDSQAAIELYNNYCQHKRCLSCQIGLQLIK